MKERTSEWIHLFEHKSLDPVEHCENESNDYGYIEVYYDTQTEANGTIEWENIKERTSEWIHLLKHKFLDPVEHCENKSIDHVEHYEDKSIDCGDSEVYYDTQTEANETIELEYMTERTREWVDLPEHGSFDLVA